MASSGSSRVEVRCAMAFLLPFIYGKRLAFQPVAAGGAALSFVVEVL